MATEALERTDDDSDETINLGGRPTVYRAQYAKVAYRMALLGTTDKDLAAAFDVSEQTITTWKNTHPRFLASLRKGKEQADANVAHKLYSRATGYKHKETKVMVVDNCIQEVETIKHYPPDTAAAKLWLTNRRPDLWKDRSNVDVTSNGQTIGSLAAAAWAYGEEIRAQQQVQTIEAVDAQKLLSVPAES